MSIGNKLLIGPRLRWTRMSMRRDVSALAGRALGVSDAAKTLRSAGMPVLARDSASTRSFGGLAKMYVPHTRAIQNMRALAKLVVSGCAAPMWLAQKVRAHTRSAIRAVGCKRMKMHALCRFALRPGLRVHPTLQAFALQSGRRSGRYVANWSVVSVAADCWALRLRGKDASEGTRRKTATSMCAFALKRSCPLRP